MIRMTLMGTALVLAGATTLLADFQYQQTTTVTGGAMAGMMRMAGAFSKQAREPIVQKISVKGNRMAHIGAHSGTITDLDKETITHIDFDRKTYSVQTFEEMKRALQEAMAKAKSEKAEGSENIDAQFKASVRKTNATKPISGMSTNEFILDMMIESTDQKSGQKGSFAMSNDMWMAADIAGYKEVNEFNKRMAAKMGTVLSDAGFNPMMMGRADMAKGMQEMAKEMSKLQGVPVLVVTRMGSTTNGKPLPAASEAPEAAKASNGPDVNVKDAAAKSAQESATSSALGRLGGLGGGLGGRLGGLGRRKQQEQPQEQPQQQQQQAQQQTGPAGQQAAILMETTTESSSFSSAPVDPATFEVPAGFKQVEPESGRRRR